MVGKDKQMFTPSFPLLGELLVLHCHQQVNSASACSSRFFTDEVWELLVVETNRFAAQFRASQSASRPRPWHDVTEEEMKAFVGMLMVMGICKLPRIENYWSTSHPLFTPQLREVMPLVRFSRYRFLHLADSSVQIPYGQPGYDPLFKVQPA